MHSDQRPTYSQPRYKTALGILIAVMIVAVGYRFTRDDGESAHEGDKTAAVDAQTPADAAHGEGKAAEAHDDEAAHAEEGHGVPDVAWYWMIPFIGLLGSIAVCPLINMHFWEHNYPWFAIVLGLITAVYYVFVFDDPNARGAWFHEMQEYVSFIALLGSLYIVSGGIVIHVSRTATPMTNTVLLLVGAVLANVVGTTGAAMLLIRPYIRINREHIKPYHIIFFIFIVANCGGCLTPIGDPPLFMGFLKGVPFFWVLEACWPMWAVALVILLVIFYIIDKRDHATMQRQQIADTGPAVEIFGFQNFLFIVLILIGVFQPSFFQVLHDGPTERLFISREILMAVAALGSKFTTKPYIYERNEFTYGPIREVAILFVGIFSTMVPALNFLNHHSEQMPLKTPGQYYFITGTLSAMLDNAPTYLVFLETKQGQIQTQYTQQINDIREYLDNHAVGEVPPIPVGKDKESTEAIETLIQYKRSKVAASTVTDADIRIALIIANSNLALYLIAISVGAVFFGACTYIGNGPNFMVKSIAESAGITMPSFFGYVIKYSLPILIPVYVLIWVIFFVFKIGV